MSAVLLARPAPGRWHQTGLALLASIIAVLPMLALPIPYIMLGVAILPFALIFAFANPFALCLAFIIFSFFRIHEVFPVLEPLQIPRLLAAPTLIVLFWHIFIARSIKTFWSAELTAFTVFFSLVTLGLFVAANRPQAIAYWSNNYWKMAVMTFCVAWLTRTPTDFGKAARFIVLAGIAVSWVTLYNKVNGIGLVEGTRVTIGRDIRSVLGDPNDLSLVLLFPLSFAAALAVQRKYWFSVLLGIIGVCLIIPAIIATQSRGGLLGLSIVMAVVGSRLIKSKAVLFSVGGIALMGLFAVAGISGRSSGGAGESGIDESSMGRIYAWGAAWKMALTHPLNGVGLDNFVVNYYFYSDHWDGLNHAVHSTWFNVIAETGFPGIITFVTMIVVMFRQSIRASGQLRASNAAIQAQSMGLAVVAGTAGFCVSGTFLTQGFTWPVYILLAMSAAIGRYAREENEGSHEHNTLRLQAVQSAPMDQGAR